MLNRRNVTDLFTEHSDIIERARANIEKYRKGDITVTVKNSDGEVLPGALVRIRQKRHSFRFGANLFMLGEFESDEKNKQYEKYFRDLFNMATLPFYWNATEQRPGCLRYNKDSERMYRRPPIDLCLEFCDKYGIEPREHALAYERFFPGWLYDKSVCEIKKALRERMEQVSRLYAGRIHTIEVTNELDWAAGRTAFYHEPDYLEWCMKTADELFPDNEITVNEFTHLSWKGGEQSKYYKYLRKGFDEGLRIDAIGMQYHMFCGSRENEYSDTREYYDPRNIAAQTELYAGFGKPLQMTEITVPAWSHDREDEEVQADIIENLYTLWFSHPSVEQIIYWNTVDGYAHVDDPSPEKIAASLGNMSLGENVYYGGLVRFDMTPKPAYRRLYHLINKKWHTDVTAVTGDDGCARERGFFGEYEISAEHSGYRRSVTLDSSHGGEVTIVI